MCRVVAAPVLLHGCESDCTSLHELKVCAAPFLSEIRHRFRTKLWAMCRMKDISYPTYHPPGPPPARKKRVTILTSGVKLEGDICTIWSKNGSEIMNCNAHPIKMMRSILLPPPLPPYPISPPILVSPLFDLRNRQNETGHGDEIKGVCFGGCH